MNMNKLTQKELDGVPLRSMCGEEHELEGFVTVTGSHNNGIMLTVWRQSAIENPITLRSSWRRLEKRESRKFRVLI